MRLDNETKEKIREEIEPRCCPMCGASDRWATDPVVRKLAPYDPPDQARVEAPVASRPVVAEACKSCGHLALLSPEILGISL